MTPLEKIRQGILTGDLYLVTEGYNAFTDSPIVLQKVHEPEKPQHNESPITSFNRSEPSRRTREDEKVDAKAIPFQVKQRRNLWNDDGSIATEDKKFDQLNKNVRRTLRRPDYQPVVIPCEDCGKIFNVNPDLVFERKYRCDRCTGKKSR
jgi:hypothetical protein